MANSRPVRCQIRYTRDLAQLDAFKTYARTWMSLIERYGDIHHGYFISSMNRDEVGVSFPNLRYDGPTGIAIAMFTLPYEGITASIAKRSQLIRVHNHRRSRARVWLLHTIGTPFPSTRGEAMKQSDG